jgi:hypothetical protein
MIFQRYPIEEGDKTHTYVVEEKCIYRIKNTKPNGLLYLNCIERTCRAKGRICANNFVRTNRVQHSHPDHALKAEYEIAYAKLREAVHRERRREVRSIHREEIRSMGAETAGLLAWSRVRRTIQRIRQLSMPSCSSFDELTRLLEENDDVYFTYGTLRETVFYHGAIEGHLVFANRELVAALDEMPEIYVDATYGITPFRTHQLLVVLAELFGRPRPIAFAVMKGKMQKDYAAVFTLLKRGVLSFDGVFRTPVSATCDFELGLRNGLKDVWPDIKTIGCNFHFHQCLRRKAASIDTLSTKITGQTSHHTVLFLFMRLSFLPLDRINIGFDAIINYINSQDLAVDYAEFISYFKKTWFKRYPKEQWEVSGRLRRTNNNVEGYNNFLKLSIPPNPNPWVFLEGLVTLAHDASASYHGDKLRNIQPPKDRSLITLPLKNALIDLNEGKINEFEFLWRLA